MALDSIFYRLNQKVKSIEELNKIEEKAIKKPKKIDFDIKEIYSKEGNNGVLEKLFKDELTSSIDMLFLEYRISLAEENVDKYNKDYLEALINGFYDPIEKEIMGYWSCHGDLQRYMTSLYHMRGFEGDINSKNIILEREDIITLITIAKLAIKGEYTPTEIGFNWDDTNQEDWERTIVMLEQILDTTDFDKETIYYYSWW